MASGSVIVLAAVAAEVRVVKKFVLPLSWRLPVCPMAKRVLPDEEAVKMSPAPRLSTTRPAKED